MPFALEKRRLRQGLMNKAERLGLACIRHLKNGRMYSLFNRGELFMSQQLERSLITLLRRHSINSIGDKKILEVGCGTGWPLRRLVNYGAKPANLSGIDLLKGAVKESSKLSPNIAFMCGNAQKLPFRSGSYDMVMQFTMFTSILDAGIKRSAAQEMLRVLKEDGLILWYDFYLNSPGNADVKGIGKTEITMLFPGCFFDFNKVTLAPPIARTLAPHSFLACYLLEKIPLLRTHYLVAIKKRGSD